MSTCKIQLCSSICRSVWALDASAAGSPAWPLTCPPAGPPRNQPLTSGKPSRPRLLLSERSYSLVKPVALRKASASACLKRSTPALENCATSVSPYWSTIKPGKPSDSPCTRRSALLGMSNCALALTERATAASKNAASMRCFSSKLQALARILETGLKAAQAKNWPSADSTRTVSPLSAPPRATAPSNTQGWRRNKERSLPGLRRIDFMGSATEEEPVAGLKGELF